MFLMKPFRPVGTIRARLTIWFSGLIIGCLTAFFFISFFFLSSTLKTRDLNDILSELSELSSEVESHGIEGFRTFVDSHLSSRLKELLFIRVALKDNKTIFTFSPEIGSWFDMKLLEKKIPEKGKWVYFKSDENRYELDLNTNYLDSGVFIQVGMSSHRRAVLLNHFKKLFIMGTLPFIILAFAGASLFSFRFLKPIRNIISTVESIDAGRMDSRVARTYNNDELDKLGRLFNEMLDTIGHLINGMKESLDNVAHDIRTPLTRLRNTAESALKNLDDVNIGRNAHESAIEESERILSILEALMDISEAESGIMSLNYEEVSLYDLIYPVYDLYSFIGEGKNIEIKIDVSKEIKLSADLGKMRQAVANILDNAVKFSRPEGVVKISGFKDETVFVISVKDNGIGIDEKEKDKIFDRLYRGESSRFEKGLGLGLSLVKAIVNAHGGAVTLESFPGKGSDFRIELPLT